MVVLMTDQDVLAKPAYVLVGKSAVMTNSNVIMLKSTILV